MTVEVVQTSTTIKISGIDSKTVRALREMQVDHRTAEGQWPAVVLSARTAEKRQLISNLIGLIQQTL